jgi:hypothetical protein
MSINSDIIPAPNITTIISDIQPISQQHISQQTDINIDIDNVTNIDDESNGYIEKLNYDIGYFWWKQYVYCAFWSNISTPINLLITILTALTTGQSATNSLISQSTSIQLGVAALFISIFNTFFRPTQQLNDNTQVLKEWMDIGQQFEDIYYDKVYTLEEKKGRLQNLQALFMENNKLKRNNNNNFVIDLIFICADYLCIKNKIYWIHDNFNSNNPNNPLSRHNNKHNKKNNKKNNDNTD